MNIKSVLSVILLIVFKYTLEFTYVNYVRIIYPEFPLNVNTFKVIESYILTFILSVMVVLLFNELKKPSYVVVYILLLNLIIPLLAFYSQTDASRPFVYSAIASFFIVMVFVRSGRPLRIFHLLESRAVLVLCIISITIVVFSNLLIGGGLSRLSFDLLKVYEIREQYLSTGGFMMGYFLPWSAYSINTFLIAYFLYKKKKIFLILTLLFQVFLYATTGFKSYLFAPLLIFAIHFALNVRNVKKLLPFLTFGFIVIVIYSYLRYIINGDILTGSIFIRRNFFTPAQIHFLYYEYFSINPFVLLSDSLLKPFIDNPYGDYTPVRYIISEHIYGRQFGLNVGFIGNAFMHFGYFGIFMFSIFLGLTLRILDSISLNLPISVAVSSIIIPSMAFVNSGFFTVLLTHGFFISCFFIWLLSGHVFFNKRRDAKKPINTNKYLNQFDSNAC